MGFACEETKFVGTVDLMRRCRTENLIIIFDPIVMNNSLTLLVVLSDLCEIPSLFCF